VNRDYTGWPSNWRRFLWCLTSFKQSKNWRKNK